MQRIFGLWRIVLLVFVFFPIVGNAKVESEFGPKGDGDVFPHSCVDFSGTWVTQEGVFYFIEQESCRRVHIVVGRDKKDFLDMLLDNETRQISCIDGLKALARHHWNSLDYATKIYSLSTYTYADRVTLYQFELEALSHHVLEAVKKRRTVFFGSGRSIHEYEKFRLYRYFAD